jgi:hypothetical protein
MAGLPWRSRHLLGPGRPSLRVSARKGGKVVTIALAPRTARAIDLAIGERCDGPVFLITGMPQIARAGPGPASLICQIPPTHEQNRALLATVGSTQGTSDLA